MHFQPPAPPVKLYETGFENDIFGRENEGKRLSDLLERIKDPLVVALDGRWGTGKTHFLQRWVGAHCRQNGGRANTLYFDAFAHDYMGDPLIALISELSSRLSKVEPKKLDRIKSLAGKLMRPLSRIALAAASSGASEVLNATGDAIVQATAGEAEAALNTIWAHEQGRRAAMEEFSDALSALTRADGIAPNQAGVEASKPGEAGAETPTAVVPLIIVIDELDRCRPDYALDLLEVIKHFFAVPHVHFVLGVNLQALENSVRARYGPDLDATSYLQKFISFTFNLPVHSRDPGQTPNIVTYAKFAGPSMGLPRHLLEDLRNQLSVLSKANNISIRDVKKILSYMVLLPSEVHRGDLSRGVVMTLITMLIFKVARPDFYRRLMKFSVSRSELQTALGFTEEDVKNKHHSLRDRLGNSTRRDLLSSILGYGPLEKPKDWPGLEVGIGLNRVASMENVLQYIHTNWLSQFKLPA